MNIQKRLIAFAFMLGISSVAWGAIPPPPVNQNLGIPDTVFSFQNANVCQNCHDGNPPVGVPVNPGVNEDRHHLNVDPLGTGTTGRLADGSPDFPPFRDPDGDGINNEYLTCTSCHVFEINPATGENEIVNNFRNCLNCHEWTEGDTSVHHRTEQAQQGSCFACHGSLVRGIDVDTLEGKRPDPENPGQTIPVTISSTAPNMITPWRSAKPNGDDRPENISSAGEKPGSCAYCHNTATGSGLNPDGSGGTPEEFTLQDGTTIMIDIFTNMDNHHGTGFFAEQKCAWCHSGVDMQGNQSDFLQDARAIRTCQRCHDVPTLHNIEFDAVGDGLQAGREEPYYGHVGNTANCWGCHGHNNTVVGPNGELLDPRTLEPIVNQSVSSVSNSIQSASSLSIQSASSLSNQNVGGAELPDVNVSSAVVPTIKSLSIQSIPNGTDTVITATGTSFTNTAEFTRSDGSKYDYTYTSEVHLTDSDGNITVIEPTAQDYSTLEFVVPSTMPVGYYDVAIHKAFLHTAPLGLSITPAIQVGQALIYTPYGPLVIISGAGFSEGLELSRIKGFGTTLVDQNGTPAARIYAWSDDLIIAHFYDEPTSVTITNIFNEKVVPLTRY